MNIEDIEMFSITLQILLVLICIAYISTESTPRNNTTVRPGPTTPRSGSGGQSTPRNNTTLRPGPTTPRSGSGGLTRPPLTTLRPLIKTCYGYHSGFGYTGSLLDHYNRTLKTYGGCTHVYGNLIITHFVDPSIRYNLNSLKSIRYVSGYVLIAANTRLTYIDLGMLDIIRGNQTVRHNGSQYTLFVALNSGYESTGLTELRMPALKEINNGQVMFQFNPHLKYVNTIYWDAIMRGKPLNVIIKPNGCDNRTLLNEEVPHCENCGSWGNSTAYCQQAKAKNCHSRCNGRCTRRGIRNCCHHTCAAGCTGAGANKCFLCKDFKYNGSCVAFCPMSTYERGFECHPDVVRK